MQPPPECILGTVCPTQGHELQQGISRLASLPLCPTASTQSVGAQERFESLVKGRTLCQGPRITFPPGARFEGSISPALLPLSPPCMCQACSPLGTLTHLGAWTHGVHRQWSPHTLGPCSPALKAHTPSHSHSCIQHFHRTRALPARTHTHTHLCARPAPILPCPHTYSMHPHAHTPPRYLSVHTLGADRPSHATNRSTPTFRYSPGHSSRPAPAPVAGPLLTHF